MAKQLTRVSKGMTEGRFGEVDVSRIDLDGVLELTVDDGQHITLTGHGAADFEITGFGDKLPIGYEFSVYIPRTIGDTGGVGNSNGNYVQFIHSMNGDGIDLTINKRMDNDSPLYTYQAYPNSCDVTGRSCALYEQLHFVSVGNGRTRLIKLPDETSVATSGYISLKANGITEQNRIITLGAYSTDTRREIVWTYGKSCQFTPVIGFTFGAVEPGLIGNNPPENFRHGAYRSGNGTDSTQATVSVLKVAGGAGASIEMRGNMTLVGRWKPNV